jgi:hypothetical protein
MSSARPPYITTFVSPNVDRPAVSAKGTVRPSDSPIVASAMVRGLTFVVDLCDLEAVFSFVWLYAVSKSSDVTPRSKLLCELCCDSGV